MKFGLIFSANRKTLLLTGAVALGAVILAAIIFWPRSSVEGTGATNTIPSLPLLATWEATNGQVIKSVVVDTSKTAPRVYLAAGFDGLIVLSATDLTAVGQFVTNQPVNDVVLKTVGTNTYAFLALGTYRELGGAMVLDVADPTNPVPAGLFLDPALSASAVDVLIMRNSLFLATADERSGFVTYRMDWSNSAIVTNRIASLNGKAAADIFVQGQRVFVAARDEGVFIIDAGSGRVLSRIKPTLCLTNSVFASGRILCVGDKMSGVTLYDISNPGAPRRISSYSSPGDAYDVVMIRNTIYVADGINGVLKIRWAGGDRFTLLNQFSDGSLAYQLFITEDEKIYAACGSGGLRVLDGRSSVSETPAGTNISQLTNVPVSPVPTPVSNVVPILVPPTHRIRPTPVATNRNR